MLVVQAGIERLSINNIKQVEEVATFNQDCRHKRSRKSILVITKNIHFVGMCNRLGKRGEKTRCLRNGFKISC